MSRAVPPPGKQSDTLQSTRQMLDELDVLMDRMLAIPVNDADEPAPRPGDIVRMPTVSATLTVLEAPVEDEEGPAQEERPAAEERPLLRESFPNYSTEGDDDSARDSSHQPMLLQPQHLEAPPAARETAPDPIPEEMIPPSILALTAPGIDPAPLVTLIRPPQRSLADRCLAPLLWFNQAFDKVTMPLGEPGHWLRRSTGRRVLGVTGVALLAVAGLWLVKDWLGWTW